MLVIVQYTCSTSFDDIHIEYSVQRQGAGDNWRPHPSYCSCACIRWVHVRSSERRPLHPEGTRDAYLRVLLGSTERLSVVA